ncbi:MAG: FixH family protein [Chitinophagaceae bacterium]
MEKSISSNINHKTTISWGNILLVAFLLFIALMVVMVYNAVNTTYDLVSKDYYKEELRYQDKIDGVTNALKLGNVHVQQTANNIIIQLPNEVTATSINGSVLLYCKTDANKDKKFILNTNNQNVFSISKKGIVKGEYQLQIQWTALDKQYYVEKIITVL